ncbi:helix-turn-helix domain-containing protein [Achromobacter deleyi]|uniref:helix-turn-helix domain-containing protein n=1 Tax=Achromobacter deleyi TaxID=1353891 RepID=UPI001492C15A|nr:helix-turn-helix domain-containing protein [Achromobacter deleyi]QVQ27806.1 helix-turn-helix domain-containing protein [Achromobacter deleyi]UIP23410.1 helix-turn-helix domain-containing protein [Achromobacter deleyi]
MDFLIASAARALAAGDPLGALNHVALRGDAAALALRGIAMAQLGDLICARTLLRGAARAFGPKDAAARARCVVAEAEIALASRDLGWPEKALDAARATLQAHGDFINAAHACQLKARRQLLLGRLDEAERSLASLDTGSLPWASRAIQELIAAGIAMRRQRAKAARAALTRAELAASHAGIPALMAEVQSACQALNTPAARLLGQGAEQPLLLDDVEALLASGTIVVDACRHAVRDADAAIALAGRPVLFALARALAEAWPHDVPREALIAQAFRTRYFDETHRARLRVEIGRLRTAIRKLAGVSATQRGFVLKPAGGRPVAVLARPADDADPDQGALLAFLADGESWSSSALALVLGASQRTVQRALDALADAGKVQPFGHGRARRWMTPPMPGFASSLLLPGILPGN